MDVDAKNVYINGTLPTTSVNPQNPFDVPRGEPSLANAQAVTTIAEAVASAADALAAESDAALALIEAQLAAQEAANAANAAALADLFAKLGLDANGEPLGSTTINVTVEGSVTAVQDLAEVITDIQYEYQRNGKGLRFSSIAI
jgi:membrane protein involved in colicin uptake